MSCPFKLIWSDTKRLAKSFFCKTPKLKIDADRFNGTDTKRLAKPFCCKTPKLKIDANRFSLTACKRKHRSQSPLPHPVSATDALCP